MRKGRACHACGGNNQAGGSADQLCFSERLGGVIAADAPYVTNAGPPWELRQKVTGANGALDLWYQMDALLGLQGLRFLPHVPKEVVLAPGGPPYADTARFSERELTFGEAEYPLTGILALPQGAGPFPAVVLVHGSGSSDRDEAIGPNKPFRDLAWGLASRGIAVFRYDKRTYAHGNRMAAEAITIEEEVLADAVAAVALVAGQPEIDARRLFVAGHSMGGTMAPIIASRTSVAGMVLLAGTPRPLYELMLEQYTYLAALDGQITAEEQAHLDAVAADTAKVKAGAYERGDVLLQAPAGYWEAFKTLDPVQVARTLSLPALVLQGGRDYQVTATDYSLWQQGLAGTPSEFRLFPTLNHLFMPGSGPATPAEYMVPGHVAPEVVEAIADWVWAVAGRAGDDPVTSE